MNRDLVKKIAFLSGTIIVFVAGIVYNICADLFLKTESTWLFGSIIFAFGSGIFALFSDNFREKHKIYFTFKGLAVGFALLFVGFLVVYQIVAVPQLENKTAKVMGTIIDVVSIVISVLALAALAIDLGLSVKSVKADEE